MQHTHDAYPFSMQEPTPWLRARPCWLLCFAGCVHSVRNSPPAPSHALAAPNCPFPPLFSEGGL